MQVIAGVGECTRVWWAPAASRCPRPRRSRPCSSACSSPRAGWSSRWSASCRGKQTTGLVWAQHGQRCFPFTHPSGWVLTRDAWSFEMQERNLSSLVWDWQNLPNLSLSSLVYRFENFSLSSVVLSTWIWILSSDELHLLEFEFSGEFVLRLLELLSLSHVFLLQVLNLLLRRLQLGEQLQRRILTGPLESVDRNDEKSPYLGITWRSKRNTICLSLWKDKTSRRNFFRRLNSTEFFDGAKLVISHCLKFWSPFDSKSIAPCAPKKYVWVQNTWPNT